VAALLGVLHYSDAGALLQFCVGILALALLTRTVGVGTETVDARFGPPTTGVLQSTLGNLAELFNEGLALVATYAGSAAVVWFE